MASIIRMKRSSVATKVPTTAQLDLGELAINTRDGKLFLKRADGTEQIVEVGARWGAFTLINNGFIMGKGGDGGYLTSGRASYMAPTSGGPAIALTGPIIINNTNGYIGGGGGGGAGATGAPDFFFFATELFSPGGGGAGGGRGGAANNGNTSGTTLGAFGEGGAIGQIGSVSTAGNPWAGQTIAQHGGAGGASGAVVHGTSGRI